MMTNNNANARTAPARPAAPARTQPPRRPAAPPQRPQAAAPARKKQGWLSVADHRYTLAKLGLVALLVVYVLLVLGTSTAKDVPMERIAPRLANIPSVAALSPGDANAFRERFGLDPEGCEGWLLYASDDLMDVSELLVVKAADGTVRDRIEAAADARLAAQKESFRNYGTDQYALLGHALLWQRGDYLFYGVSADIDRWEDEFLACIQ